MDTHTHNKKALSWSNIFLVLTFFFLGFIFQSALSQKILKNHSSKDLSLFWEVWDTMDKKYPFEKPSDKEKIFGAIEGMVASYKDDYSSFLPPVRSEFFNQTINGEFGGAGMEIGVREGLLVVISPLKNSPAEKAGILPNDIITHVDGVDIAGDSLDEAIGRIRGKIGTKVVIRVVRKYQEVPLDLELVREIVHIPVLETEVMDEVFIIHLYNFNESSDQVFKGALEEFKKSGKKRLLLDVRNNPGGYLNAAVNIASYFLPQGSIIVKEQYGESLDDVTLYRSKGYDLMNDYPFETMVLINEGSASASEILAGALSENDKALLVGERSYGKGSVQELLSLPQATSLKVTVAKWLTPQDHQISKVGIVPDVAIATSSDEGDGDRQLQEAVILFDTQ